MQTHVVKIKTGLSRGPLNMKNWRHRKLQKNIRTIGRIAAEKRFESDSIERLNRSGLYHPENAKNTLTITRLTPEEIADRPEALAARARREDVAGKRQQAVQARGDLNRDQPAPSGNLKLDRLSRRAMFELSAQRALLA